MASFRDLLAHAKAEIREVDTAAAEAAIGRPGTVVLDVREPDEYDQGALPGALHIPRGHLESQVEGRLPDHDAPVVVYCAGGVRSAFAAKTLQDLGYTDVVSMAGGFGKWKDEGRAWRVPVTLTPDQRNRYQRHLLLPEVGVEGQAKLLESKVLLLGAGGLGSPAALYLAAAGVGTLGIVDMDEVDESNLQRQILHNLDRIGERKVDSAKKTLVGPQPRRQRRHLRHPAGGRERDRPPRRLRRRHRRRRQLPEPLPAQRRLGEARHPRRARLDLPVRGHGHRLRPEARARTTATWCPSRRPPIWPRAAPRPACSACCPASSAASRRSRPSSCCSTWAIRSSGAS